MAVLWIPYHVVFKKKLYLSEYHIYVSISLLNVLLLSLNLL